MTTRRKILAAVLVAVCTSCSPAPPAEQQVRALIEEAEHSAEARDVSDAMALVSARYSDSRGWSRADVERFVRGYFLLNQSIRLLTRIEQLEFPTAELAHARVAVAMLGRRDAAGRDLSLAADHYELDIELVREGGEWRLLHAEVRRPGG